MLQRNTFNFIFSFNRSFLLGFIFVLFISNAFSQDVKPASKNSKKPITAEFVVHDVDYTEMAVISNVLKITNNNGKNYTVSVKISLPIGWRTLNKSSREYTLAPGDTLYVPVRLITSNKAAKGGTKYDITAIISTKGDGQIASSNFLAGRKKISNWQMEILPRSKIYFLHGEDNASFQVDLANNGDEDQNIVFSMNKIGRDFSVVDTTGSLLKKNFIEFQLKPFSDTIVPFHVKIQKAQRNVKRIDTYGYIPNSIDEERHYSLFLRASETGTKPGGGNNKSKKLDFVKLSNNIDFIKLNDVTKVNQYGASCIPLTMVANFNNILGIQPLLNLLFYGNTQLNKKSRLDYFLQSGFSYYRLSNRIVRGSSGYIGYYHEKFFVTVGSGVGLNLGNVSSFANGRGITAGYHITPSHSVGVYYLRVGQSFIDYQSAIYGAAYSGRFKKIQVGAGYARTEYVNHDNSNSFNLIASSPIGRFQTISLNGRYIILNHAGAAVNRKYVSLFYAAHYLKERANSSLNFTYNEGYSGFGNGILANSNYKNINLGTSNAFRVKKNFRISLFDNYYSFQTPTFPIGTLQNNFIFTNSLNFELPHKTRVTYIPAIYCNYSYYNLERLLSGGLQLGVNNSNMDENFRLGLILKGGYNKLLNFPQYGVFFTGQSNLLLSYHTWNLNVRYTYGPQMQSNLVNMFESHTRRYPQSLFVSLGYQHQFENKHFIWENTVNYSYLNTNQSHNVGLFSQLFYYSNNGWQININVSYNYNLSANYKYIYSPGTINNFVVEETNTKTANQSIQLGVGVKKDFCIPIPKRFTKSRFGVANIKTFLDINGNRNFDAEDVPIENVVIRLGDNEVLTNEKGEASFLNIGYGFYKFSVIPLVDIGAWFPVLVGDSIDVSGQPTIYIPFSKGVQILGNVTLDREKFSSVITENLDISRIKIYLVDSLGKTTTSITDNRGNFKFYVPYGNYTLKFDEKILGTNFELSQNDVSITLSDGMESYYYTFFVVEKKRKVVNKKFGPDGNIIDTDTKNESEWASDAKKKLEHPAIAAKPVTPELKSFDTDHDGKISLKEVNDAVDDYLSRKPGVTLEKVNNLVEYFIK